MFIELYLETPILILKNAMVVFLEIHDIPVEPNV